MIGIKPIEIDNLVQFKKRIYLIKNLINKYGNELLLHAVSTERRIKCEIPNTHIPRHDVIILATQDGNNQMNINQMLVEQNLCEYDPKTKDKLNNVPNVVEKDSDSDWDNQSYVSNDWVMTGDNANRYYSEDDENELDLEWIEHQPQDQIDSFLYDLLNAQNEDALQPLLNNELNSIDPKIQSIEPIQELDEISENENDEISNENLIEWSECSEEDSNDRAQLEYIYKRPQIIWWQTDDMIILSVGVQENAEYGFEITPNSIVFV